MYSVCLSSMNEWKKYCSIEGGLGCESGQREARACIHCVALVKLLLCKPHLREKGIEEHDSGGVDLSSLHILSFLTSIRAKLSSWGFIHPSSSWTLSHTTQVPNSGVGAGERKITSKGPCPCWGHSVTGRQTWGTCVYLLWWSAERTLGRNA